MRQLANWLSPYTMAGTALELIGLEAKSLFWEDGRMGESEKFFDPTPLCLIAF